MDYYRGKYCKSLVINRWETHWSYNKSLRSYKTPKQTERDWQVNREEGGEGMFISHEICVRLAHNKYVHVLLENPREGRRKQNQIDYPESPKRTNSSSQVEQQDFHRELFLWSWTGVCSCFQLGHKHSSAILFFVEVMRCSQANRSRMGVEAALQLKQTKHKVKKICLGHGQGQNGRYVLQVFFAIIQ